MYPDLYYLLKEFSGIEWLPLHHITTFGLSIAISFIFGMYYLKKDLLLKEAIGYYTVRKNTLIQSGKPAKLMPSETVGSIALLCTICGLFLGKIFYLLENNDEQHSLQSILSFAGINYYGALAGMLISPTIYYYQRNINPIAVFDSASPGFMISYSIGRLGCHLSGDGDWGIENTSPKPFSWIPDGWWASGYPHNIIREGIIMKPCDWGNYCYQLAVPVFPTPLYEFVICLIFFIILWKLRKKSRPTGFVLGIYMMLTGVERFLIEFIRVNPRIQGLGITQAQLISLLLIIAGATIIMRIYRNRNSAKEMASL